MIFLQITLNVAMANRAAAADIYSQYKAPFLNTIPGAKSKELLIREEDVQVLHGFDSLQHANEYLKSSLFTDDIVSELQPLLEVAPDIRIYQVA